MKKLMLISALVTVFTSFAALAGGCGEKTPVTLNIAAAATLKDVLTEINGVYMDDNPQVTILSNFTSSGTIQVQIENGAPVDVFISGASLQMDNLENKGLIVEDTRRDLLNNKIVLIVPKDSTLDITSFNDLASDRVNMVAFGDPGAVTAGMYGQKALEELGIWSQVQPKLVFGNDVRQVLAFVESGNVDAGVVYLTDAKISNQVRVVANAPDAINDQIVYPAAVIKASTNQDAARDYLDFLFTDKAAAIFEKYGFSLAGE